MFTCVRPVVLTALALATTGCALLKEPCPEGSVWAWDVEECVGDDDADGDRWLAYEDCDDGNSTVHPDALELCDGVDNDCDEEIDEDCDGDEDTDTDTETETEPLCEEGDLCLISQFSTAWSAAVPFEVEAGEKINLGALLFTSNDYSEMFVSETVVQFYVSSDVEGGVVYTAGESNGISASDVLEECWFSDVTNTTTLYAGPPSEVPEDGRLVFADNDGLLIWLADGIGTAANVRCTLRTDAPVGVGIAVDLIGSTAYVGSPNDDTNELALEEIAATNGEHLGDTIVPTVAVIVE